MSSCNQICLLPSCNYMMFETQQNAKKWCACDISEFSNSSCFQAASHIGGGTTVGGDSTDADLMINPGGNNNNNNNNNNNIIIIIIIIIIYLVLKVVYSNHLTRLMVYSNHLNEANANAAIGDQNENVMMMYNNNNKNNNNNKFQQQQRYDSALNYSVSLKFTIDFSNDDNIVENEKFIKAFTLVIKDLIQTSDANVRLNIHKTKDSESRICYYTTWEYNTEQFCEIISEGMKLAVLSLMNHFQNRITIIDSSNVEYTSDENISSHSVNEIFTISENIYYD